MLPEPHFNADGSAQLDLVLAQYLQTHPFELDPAACPPWRDGNVISREQLPQESSGLKTSHS